MKLKLRYKETSHRSFLFASVIRVLLETKYPNMTILEPASLLPDSKGALQDRSDVEQLVLRESGNVLVSSYLLFSAIPESAIGRLCNRAETLILAKNNRIAEYFICISAECPRNATERVNKLRMFAGEQGVHFEFWEGRDVRKQVEAHLKTRFPAFEAEHMSRFLKNRPASWTWRLQTDSEPEPATRKAGNLFVCHASEDKPFVSRLVSALDRHAEHVWYDAREILAGDSITEMVNKGLEESDCLIVVLSAASVNKPWLKRELSFALNYSLSGGGIRIIPVLIEDCPRPALIADLLYADFRSHFATGINQVIAALQQMA